MKRYWAYFKYIIRHKYYVGMVGRLMGISFWILFKHDLSKLLPSEFFPYAKALYSEKGESRYIDSDEFERAWILHQHRNRHHWQYWVSLNDSGSIIPIQMDYAYVQEMVADMLAMTYTLENSDTAIEYFNRIKDHIRLHPSTLTDISRLLIKYTYLDDNSNSTVRYVATAEDMLGLSRTKKGNMVVVADTGFLYINVAGDNKSLNDWKIVSSDNITV